MNNEEIQNGPIIPMLIKLSLPIFAGMIVQLIYNITDTLWLSRIDLNDPGIVGGTGLIFPVMFLAIALANGIQTGVSSLTARSIGKNNTEELHKIGINGLIIASVLALCIMIPTYLWTDRIITFMGAKESFFTHGKDYLQAIIPAAVAMFIGSILNGILQGEGKMKEVMNAMIIGTLGNLILDPIFIFPMKMGVQGAASATVVAQLLALLYTISVFKRGISTIPITLKRSSISKKTTLSILYIGIPQILSMAIMSLSTFILNKLVVTIDSNAMTAFSLCNRFDSLQFIPIFALASALITAVGQNYGRENYVRIRQIWHSGLLLAGTTEIILAITLIILAPFIYPHFTTIPEVITYAIEQTRTVNIFFTAAVFGILARSVFQGINTPLPALILTMLRLLFISIPAAVIFIYIFKLEVRGVWYGIIAGSIIAGVASFFWVESVLISKMSKS